MNPAIPKKFDVHQAVTDRIVAALEEGAGAYERPWLARSASRARPANIASGNPYNGINIVSLWIEAQARDFASNLWGTYRQWQAKGCQVRKGEKASLVVFYKTVMPQTETASEDETPTQHRLLARASFVFNAVQVDGFDPGVLALPDAPLFDPIQAADAFITATGAVVRHGGERAFYSLIEDVIWTPDRARFIGTPTCSPAEAYYATKLHELVHWSGAATRLNRDFSKRFGDEAYAFEELIAELGAAFLCADLGITSEPRADHAAYIASWLKVLKSDNRAIFRAASNASEAANFLTAFSMKTPP